MHIYFGHVHKKNNRLDLFRGTIISFAVCYIFCIHIKPNIVIIFNKITIFLYELCLILM